MSGCKYNSLVSRTCEKGTSGCDVEHDAIPEPIRLVKEPDGKLTWEDTANDKTVFPDNCVLLIPTDNKGIGWATDYELLIKLSDTVNVTEDDYASLESIDNLIQALVALQYCKMAATKI